MQTTLFAEPHRGKGDEIWDGARRKYEQLRQDAVQEANRVTSLSSSTAQQPDEFDVALRQVRRLMSQSREESITLKVRRNHIPTHLICVD